MTPRDVLERLTLDERAEIATICLKVLPIATVHDILEKALFEDDLLELGLRLKKAVPAVE